MPATSWRRSAVVLAAGTTALLGFAGTGSAIMPTQQSIESEPGSVKVGTQLTFTGTLTGMGDRPLSGEKVALERRGDADQPWSVARTTTTNAEGVASIAATIDRSGQWRLRFTGDQVYDPAASRALTVQAWKPKPAPKPAGQRVVGSAADQAGEPYSYGANGPDSFDCSGLTQYAHKLAGIELPRTSSQQRAAVREVAKSDKRPGDLVFFHNSDGSVYHVGIYAGGNQLWAAPESGDVVRKQDIWTGAYTVGRAW
ncbi:NlpC/P60 family protein [Prauserella muralis]|uniref:NlpC/P60 family protein n=1 Tax=Prauserella muralis TaxID=588067 RepID=UPI0011AC7ABF|nr:cell wall-associated NlpC family hydrolase [Prauserella muralis]